MKIFNKILHRYAMYCRKEIVKILNCYLIPKKSYGTLSKGVVLFGQPCRCKCPFRTVFIRDRAHSGNCPDTSSSTFQHKKDINCFFPA